MLLETGYLFKKYFACQEDMKPISEAELNTLHHVLLEMAEDMKEVCQKNHIFYMLGGGTALGAVRHQGFIPWDDDMDINMFHEDIELFAQELERKFPGKYYVQIPGKTKGYFSTFAQIHKRGTVFLEIKSQKEEESGIKLDIFPIENTYKLGILRRIHGWGCDAAHLLLSGYRFWFRKEDIKEITKIFPEARKRFFIKKMLSLPILIAPNFWNRMFHKWFRMCKNNDSPYVVIPSGRRHFFGELYQRASYCDTVEMPFEGTSFAVTRDIQGYMERLYGKDYMVPPPPKDRESHMIYKIKF